VTAPSRKKSAVPPVELPEAAQALGPGIDRGHHLALVAGEGAGLSALYAAAAVRDLAESKTGGRVFILSATPDRAQRCARAIAPSATAAGHETMALTSSSARGLSEAVGAEILCSTPGLLLESIRAGHVAAGAVTTLVLDDVASLTSAWPAVEAILQGADAGARRIASTHQRDAAFDELLTRQLPRARRWPAELFEDSGTIGGKRAGKKPAGSPSAGSKAGSTKAVGAKGAVTIRVASAAAPSTRVGRLAELLHDLAAASELGTATVHVAATESVAGTEAVATAESAAGTEAVATAESVAAMETALSVEGFVIARSEKEDGVRVLEPGVESGPVDLAIAFGLPKNLTDFNATFAEATRRFAIVDSLHLRQFELLAARAGWGTKPLGDAEKADVLGDVDAFRHRVTRALDRVDVGAATLLLAPLLEEHGATRVAATLAALLRESERGVEASDAPLEKTSPEVERVTRPTWSRVWVDVGKRDGAQPGDLVGAITGETGAAGGQIGRIDVRQGFTLVDVDSLVADDVVRGLNGARIKGRQVVARFDRDKRGSK